MLAILPGSVQHAEPLAAALREPDRLECEMAGDVSEIVREGFELSLWSAVAMEPSGELVAGWGVVPISALGGRAQPWCLTTPAVSRHAMAFARGTLAWVARLRREWSFLESWVDPRHAAAVRWIAWAGFTVDPPVWRDDDGAERSWAFRGGPVLRFWMKVR